ncbi:MAG: ABC transporter ATP-binding protein, partial [Spirochaetaceae bacterium]|nr:ABC transporter ATP-binding protein [Spirochaetaceae bacterium]
EERKRMTRQLLELVQLQEKEDAYVEALSRGMKQRLCLARSLIHDPKLLILDEPASGMDPRARAEMKGILRTLREMGKTVLISSHILPELAEMCDSLTILDHGQLVFSGRNFFHIIHVRIPIVKRTCQSYLLSFWSVIYKAYCSGRLFFRYVWCFVCNIDYRKLCICFGVIYFL